jgi:hypothetical protein
MLNELTRSKKARIPCHDPVCEHDKPLLQTPQNQVKDHHQVRPTKGLKREQWRNKLIEFESRT